MAGVMSFEDAGVMSQPSREDLCKIPQDDPNEDNNEEVIRAKEQLEEKNEIKRKGKQLADLIKQMRPAHRVTSKYKAAKLIKWLLNFLLDLEADLGIEVQLCIESIEWANKQSMTFLRQYFEVRLLALYFDTGMVTEALQLGSNLFKELKKVDDKNLLVEVLLLKSKTYHALSNLSKARAALTSARTTANSIHCPPVMKAALDSQSGILHIADEHDFKTAYSYFYEAFKGYDSFESPKALTALKYMLLSKIMLNTPKDVQQIVSGRFALKYAGKDIEAMKSVAQASYKRSLADFQQTLKIFKKELEEDVIVKAHLGTLYDNMLEQNLCRIIEPYSCVQVDFVSQSIKLPKLQVEKKLSQMILDKIFHGILDQGEGVLIVFEEAIMHKSYEIALETINSMGKVVDTLYQKARIMS